MDLHLKERGDQNREKIDLVAHGYLPDGSPMRRGLSPRPFASGYVEREEGSRKVLFYDPSVELGFPKCVIAEDHPANRILINGEDCGQLHAYVAHEAYNNKGGIRALSQEPATARFKWISEPLL
ncbi:MAG: hypothetical protein WCG03_07975 [Kiritimatiellales bacterium]